MIKQLLCLLIVLSSCSQRAQTTVDAADGFFGIDVAHKIIVWNTSHLNELTAQTEPIEKIRFNSELYYLTSPASRLNTKERYGVVKENDTFNLYISSFPIIHITTSDTIVDEPKIAAQFKFFSKNDTLTSAIGIELRGNSAMRYPKKSYDMELWEDASSKKSKDASFGNLREDDDWLFNSIYNEPLLLRSYFSNKLWLDVHKPYYSEEEKKAKSGIDVLYAEVFLNNTYQGMYLFNEQPDRKLLKLDKYKNNIVSGELFKALRYADATSFKAAPPFKNSLPMWDGFSMEYPYEDYEAHYDEVHDMIDFVATSSKRKFNAHIGEQIAIDNAIDYFLFINLLRATDNSAKNYFLARYKANAPYFFVPWDLDGVLGTIQDGKRIPTTNDILSNTLFDKLLENNPDDYRKHVKKRWNTLRKSLYSEKALMERLDAVYQRLVEEGVYERDSFVWQHKNNKADDLAYLKEWLQKRLTYLDGYIDNL